MDNDKYSYISCIGFVLSQLIIVSECPNIRPFTKGNASGAKNKFHLILIS